ncbi:hypothetical protein L2E82_12546 [Cichorium intybus]|uniref:Uncharacterized protein n=1 Tax=Cichorium intybus TaxID=13427 RepID=A0ACB9GG85_CICIN|nr:hypothetical protein L2E82_12546 [Cichorium intybus]
MIYRSLCICGKEISRVKLFERALVNVPENSAGRWQEIAKAVPGKTAEQVKSHYQELLRYIDFPRPSRIPVGGLVLHPQSTEKILLITRALILSPTISTSPLNVAERKINDLMVKIGFGFDSFEVVLPAISFEFVLPAAAAVFLIIKFIEVTRKSQLTAKNAAASVKETAANVAASAKSGMEKTKATLQEKKEMATEKKEARKDQAEYDKQVEREQNAVQRQAAEATGTHSYSTTGATGQHMGSHQMSALPGHGTGQPAGNVVEGVVGSHPIGRNTGTGQSVAGNNPRTGGGAGGYGTGGAYR